MKKREAGVSRAQRISDEGLQRLENQLARGVNIRREVLQQWVKRYGDSARSIIERYGIKLDQT
ncbi:MAG TPA: hypothetical protein ENJ11_08785 [Gammaproteobacteria bacterium]|nr:hypothetical protein [Gammaproteobacteria bacterium]